ncbi:MAG TPA: nitrile hydratase subunit beta [Candidatus Binatia bacterium]|nr:nitrile hydratase subunit beta [Candidatus Binatia bacterium]
MDGIHDLGGTCGFGNVEVERDEPVFHEDWERRVIAINAIGISVIRAFNTDEYRHSVERMDPVHYLSATYYERMLTGIATLFVEKGVLTRDELERRAGGRFPLAHPVVHNPPDAIVASETARYGVGQAVRVRELRPAGHTRVPRYCRGKRGLIVHVARRFSFPDAAAHGRSERHEPTYHVEFTAAELWGDAAEPGSTVLVDLWESYLEQA